MIHVRTQRLLDRFAIGISTLCIVHCLLTPVVLILVPALAATVVADEAFHKLLLIFVLPTSSAALLLGCRRHKEWRVLALGILGLAQLVAIAYVGHEELGETGETLATVAGSLLLALSHLKNYRACRADRCHT